MTKRHRLFNLSLFLTAATISASSLAAECTIDSNIIDRGEQKTLLLCGANITADYILDGLSDAKIITDYQQYIGKCDFTVNQPGLFLEVRAEDDANPASLRVLDRNTDEVLCDPIAIDVPQRIHLKDASLTNTDFGDPSIHLLSIRGEESLDLSQSCSQEMIFPQGKGPYLSLLSRQELESLSIEGSAKPPQCTKTSINALVRIRGQQRSRAKIVIPNVRHNGEDIEGVAYVTLPPAPWQSSMKQEDAKYIDVDGIRTRYFEKGEGDALVLVHGGQASSAGSNAWSWIQNFDGLAEHFHVYALDRLGQGYTDNPKTENDYQHYYERVIEHFDGFIKALGIEKVHLMGQSQGGWPVTRYAVDHPDLVSCLVNVDTGIVSPLDPQGRVSKFYRYQSANLHPPEGPTAASIRRGMKFYSYTLNNLTEAKAQRTLELSHTPRKKEAAAQLGKLRMSAAHPDFQALKKTLLQEIEDGKLKAPTLIIWGLNDPEGSYDSGVKLFKLISSTNPETEMHVFGNAGHQAFIEYPEKFNEVVVRFCSRY